MRSRVRDSTFTLFFFLATTLTLHGREAVPATQSGVPREMATFFLYNCPDGWQPVHNSMGRLVLGTVHPSEVGKITGTPLANGEVRRHGHSFTLSVTLPNNDLAGAHSCCNESGSKKGTYHSHGTVSEVAAELPFAQFAFCEPRPQQSTRQQPTGQWPLGTVSFFTGGQCPGGWEAYERADGRFVVPTVSRDDRVGKVYGNPIRDSVSPHAHPLSSRFTTQKVRYALAKKFITTNKNVAKHGTYTLEGNTTEEHVDIPFIKLTICRIKDEAPKTTTAPSGMMIFVGAQLCDVEAGWEDAPGTKGRYMVSLPKDGETGLAFGGPPLADGELRTHTHPFKGAVDLPTYKIAGAAGCCAQWYAGKGSYPYEETTAEGRVELPYVSLRQCVKK
jgi:hypothetical protein